MDQAPVLAIPIPSQNIKEFHFQHPYLRKSDFRRFVCHGIRLLVSILRRASYRNEKYGFEVKYPSNAHVAVSQNNFTITNYSPENYISLSEEELNSFWKFNINVRNQENSQLLDIDRWYDLNIKGKAAAEPISRKKITVAGLPAVQIETPEIGRWIHVYISHKADVIELAYPISSSTFKAIFELMLSTFRFY